MSRHRQRAVVSGGKQPPPQAGVTLAYAQAAVYDATAAIDVAAGHMP